MSIPQALWLTLPLVLACSRPTHPSKAGTDARMTPSGKSTSAATNRLAPAARPSSESPTTGEAAVTAEFRLLEELACDEALLHVLPGKTFLSCGQELLVLEGDEIRRDPIYQRGIEREEPTWLWQIADMAGSWPDAVWLGTNRATESAAEGRLYRWTDRGWVKAAQAGRDMPLTAILPWTERGVLALVEPPLTFGARFLALGNVPTGAPKFTAPTIPYEHCRTRLRVEAHVAVAPGEVMLAGGQVCDVVTVHGQKEPVHAGIGVERFVAGASRGQLMLLDDLPETQPYGTWQVTALVAVGPSNVLLAAHSVVDAENRIGYLARWDGTSFGAEPLPFHGGVNQLWVESPEVLWATDLQGALWRSRAGDWQRVPWQSPDATDMEITRVWVRGPSDVWLLTRSRSQNKSAVFHGRWD